MTRRRLVLVLVTFAAADLGAQRPLPPFVVGVWVTDQAAKQGAIIPFADFDGKQWHSNWPAPLDTSDGAPAPPPLTPLSTIPPAWWGRSNFEPTWELIEPTGQRRSLTIKGTDWAGHGSSCSANIGLLTNVPTRAYGYRDVLAANRAGVVEPVTTLTSTSAEWRTVSALLPGIYQRHDKPSQNNGRPDGTAPSANPTLEALSASTDASGQYVYFESWRERRDPPGDLSVAGWLWRRSASSGFQIISVQVMGRDTERGPGFRPLGVVSDDFRRFWLGVWTGWDNALAVLDVRRGRVKELVRVSYGGC